MVRATAIDPTEQITILRKYYYYRAADKALMVRNHVLVLTILRGAKVCDFWIVATLSSLDGTAKANINLR